MSNPGCALEQGALPARDVSHEQQGNLTDPTCVVGTCTYSDYGECDYSTTCNSTFSRNAAIGYHFKDGVWEAETSPGSNDNVKAGSGVLWSTPNDMMKRLAFNMGLG